MGQISHQHFQPRHDWQRNSPLYVIVIADVEGLVRYIRIKLGVDAFEPPPLHFHGDHARFVIAFVEFIVIGGQLVAAEYPAADPLLHLRRCRVVGEKRQCDLIHRARIAPYLEAFLLFSIAWQPALADPNSGKVEGLSAEQDLTNGFP